MGRADGGRRGDGGISCPRPDTSPRRPSMLLALLPVLALAQAPTITIRAGTVLDGRGGTLRNTAIVIAGSRITRLDPALTAATYDLSRLTVMPGGIDTHVHLTSHFDARARRARSVERPSTPCGTTSPSCSKPCSSSPPSTPGHAWAGSCYRRLWATSGPVRRDVVVSERDRVQRPDRDGVGILPVSGRGRSVGWDQLAVAALRDLEPAAGGGGVVRGHHRPDQDGASAVRVGHGCAARVARDRHDDGRLAEGVFGGPAARIPGARRVARRVDQRGCGAPDLQRPPEHVRHCCS